MRPILLTETSSERSPRSSPVLVNPESIAFLRPLGEGSYVNLLTGGFLHVAETPGAISRLLLQQRDALRVEERDGVGVS